MKVEDIPPVHSAPALFEAAVPSNITLRDRYSVPELLIHAAALSTVASVTLCRTYACVSILSDACFYLICCWLCFAVRHEAISFPHANP